MQKPEKTYCTSYPHQHSTVYTLPYFDVEKEKEKEGSAQTVGKCCNFFFRLSQLRLMIFDDDLKHDEVHTQRRARAHPVHGEYAARKLELNAAAIKMAARALTQQEGLRTWVWRWRRLVKLKRLGKAAARRMRQRYMLRGIRRMLAGWQAVGASAAGSRRIVAERVATMNHRRRFTHTLHAWRDVKEEGKERKRAVAKAAQRFRAVWMRSGREALSRWRENTQAKKIIIAATEIAAAGGGNNGNGNDGEPGSAGTAKILDNKQMLVTGAFSALAGWIVSWTTSAGSARKAHRDLAVARKEAAALGSANSALKELREADADELRAKAAAAEASRKKLYDEKESTGSELADAVAKAESCEAARYAAAEAHSRSLDEVTSSRDALDEKLRVADVKTAGCVIHPFGPLVHSSVQSLVHWPIHWSTHPHPRFIKPPPSLDTGIEAPHTPNA